jgi:hypothetical protein
VILRIAATTTALLLAACAASPPDPQQEIAYFREAPVCCRSLAEIRTRRIELPALFPTEIAIDQTSPAFAFETGKSPFQAIELPALPEPRRFIVRSYTMQNRDGPRKTFFPFVLLLDTEKHVAARTGWSDIVSYQGYQEVAVPVGGPSNPARYAVIYTAPELVGVGVPGTTISTMTVPVAKGVFLPFTDTRADLNYATYFGKLGLLLQ